jgi:hypothetical protein
MPSAGDSGFDSVTALYERICERRRRREKFRIPSAGLSVQNDNLRIARAITETIGRMSEDRASTMPMRTIAAYAERAERHPCTELRDLLRENAHLRGMLREATDEWFLQVVNDGLGNPGMSGFLAKIKLCEPPRQAPRRWA